MHFLAELKGSKFRFLQGYEVDNSAFTLSKQESVISHLGKWLVECSEEGLRVNETSQFQVFIHRVTDAQVLVSSSLLSLVKSLSKKPCLSWKYFIDYIALGPFPTVLTPFEGVQYLAPGVISSQKGFCKNDNSSRRCGGGVLLQHIEQYLNENIPSESYAGLEYSGGLESTILLNALHRLKPEKVKLLHINDSKSGTSDDLSHVQRTAEKYNCELVVLDFGERSPFRAVKLSKGMPNFPHPGLVNMEYIEHTFKLVQNSNITMVNGAGGDAIFCSRPQKALPYELLRSGRVFSFVNSLSNLSSCYRSPLLTMMKEAVVEYKGLANKLNDPKGFLLREMGCIDIIRQDYLTESLYYRNLIGMPVDENLTKSDRRLGALVNLYQMTTSPLSAFPGRYQYPFLSPSVLSLGLNVAPEKLLKGKVDRHFLRQAAYDRYGDESVWGTRKGGVTGLTQRAMLHNKQDVLDVLLNGPLVEKGVVDVVRIERLVDEVSVGARKCPHFLINLFSANLFIRHWEGNYA